MGWLLYKVAVKRRFYCIYPYVHYMCGNVTRKRQNRHKTTQFSIYIALL